jgi:FtsP/CotA-like multicopper oxidase with cupredoxin domain
MLAPGERADVLVNFGDLGEGSEFFLTSSKFSEFNLQGRQEFKVMKFRVTTPGTNSFQLPTVLSSLPSIPLSSATQTRNFDITTFVGGAGHGSGSKHGINGMIYEKDHMAFQVKAGSTEIWEFDNTKGDEIHPMHVHAVQFQVLSREGGRNQIFPSEKGWKDTVMVMPKEKVSVIMKFPDHLGMFVLHCHNLEHEDDGMMLNYMIS